tara:strand:+ start:3477 stop:4559 length:1083 start_codon:yes stop_codon:yes gene_type:complete
VSDLLFCSFYYRSNLKTGANKRFENIILSSLEYLIENQKIIVFIKKGNKSKYFLNDKIVVYEIPNFPILDRFLTFFLFSFKLSSFEPMIVVSDFMPIPLSALSKHYHLQLVHDIRNFTKFKRTNYFSLGKLFQKRQWEKCQNIITVSNFSKNELVKNCNINSENVFVSPNGIDNAYLKTNSDVERDIDILYVATFEKRKNHQFLIKALEHNNNLRKIKVCLIGKDLGNRQEIRILAQHLNNVEIDFIDHIGSDRELIEFYDRSNLFISPSLYEGFGMPIIEAISRGCKVLCTDTEVFREVGGESVEYFSPDNSSELFKLILDNLENKNINDVSSEFLESYKWTNISKDLIDFFNKLRPIV